MRRREFITLLGGATTWPVAARGQQSGKLPTIGFLGGSTPSVWSPWVAPFALRLRELGWVVGRNVNIEYRWAEGRIERAGEIAAEFVHRNVDVIVCVGGEIPKRATSVIPIVFAISSDPLGTGLVASLARPGRNLTGFSIQATDLASKRLEILLEMLPRVRRLVVMENRDYILTTPETNEIATAASKLGVEVIRLDVRRDDEITPEIEALKGRADALYVVGSPFTNTNQSRISIAAQSAKLPTMFGLREYVEAGGLISYGPNIPDLFRRSADLVDKILHGAKPADIPVEQPTKFDLVINLITATALGVSVPPLLLARADEVIE